MRMKMMFAAGFAAAALLPGLAVADTFSWSYGGGSDPVSAHGTLTATPDASIAGAFDILGGTGVRTDSTGTYAVSIVPFGGSNNPGDCAYSPVSNCTVVAPGGVSADLIFDNVLYFGTPGNQLDGDGFVLYEPTGPYAKYFAVWSAGASNYVGPPDQEFDPYFYSSVTLANPFTTIDLTTTGVSHEATGAESAAPEPSTLILAGIAMLAVPLLRRKVRR